MEHIVEIDDGQCVPNVASAHSQQPLHQPLQRPSTGPSPFEVGLFSYPIQPWTNRNAQLSQWFNYGLNPATWSRYALTQISLYQQYKQSVQQSDLTRPAKQSANPTSVPANSTVNVDDVLELH